MSGCNTCGEKLSEAGDCIPCLLLLGAEPLELDDQPLSSIDHYDIEKRIATGG